MPAPPTSHSTQAYTDPEDETECGVDVPLLELLGWVQYLSNKPEQAMATLYITRYELHS